MRIAAANLALSVLTLGALFGAVPPPPAVSADAFAKSALLGQAARFESEIAALMEKRGEPNDLGPLLDLEIDVRIVARWLIARSADSAPASDMQVCTLLRANSLLFAVGQLNLKIQNTRGPLTAGQLDGLKAFHDLTYKLPDLKTVGDIDQICHSLSVALFSIAGPLPSEVRDIPLMRPRVLPDDDSHPRAASSAAPALSDLLARAQEAAVSAPLRRQLIALTVAAADPQPPEAAPALFDALVQSLDLVDGIQQNTALDAAARPRLEAQLADGLALFSDVRTRSAGKARLDALGHYRDTLARIRKLKLPDGVQEKLAPAFAWIQQHPDRGSRVFDAIELYLRLCGRFDARNSPADLSAGERKAVDDLCKQFAAHRAVFLEQASSLADAGGIMVAGDYQLPGQASLMQDILLNIESLERLPRALRILAAFKPRPTGAIERRAAQAVAASGPGFSSSVREDARAVIGDIETLASLAGAAVPIAGDIPSAIGKSWAAGKLEAFDARRGLLVTELASELAGGHSMDSARLAQLQTASVMAAALHYVRETETVLRHGDILDRWADWQIDPGQLRGLIEPYRQATAAAFEDFARGETISVSQWPAAHNRYVPIITFINAMSAYVPACEQLPDGVVTELAKLATPMDGQPFATERRASFTLALRSRALQLNDAAAAAALVDELSVDLRRDLHLPE